MWFHNSKWEGVKKEKRIDKILHETKMRKLVEKEKEEYYIETEKEQLRGGWEVKNMMDQFINLLIHMRLQL